MAGYYIGYFAGSQTTPKLVQRVGHIRVFAAFASLASLSALLAAVYVNPIMWTLSRFITGISLVSCYIVTESWLNDRATNKNRGQLLSAYMIILYTGLGIGMLLLNVSDPTNYEPFILVSVLLSFALLPILLSTTEQPNFSNPKSLSLKEFYIISPLGFIGALFTGLIHSAVFGYGAVYAASKELGLFEISMFMVIISSFGALSQWPIGYLSDRIDRRIILIGTTFIASGLCLLIVGSSYLSLIMFFIFVAFYSAVCLPMYSLAVAHVNDFLKPDEIVAASSSFAILVGIGAVMGPILVSFTIKGTSLSCNPPCERSGSFKPLRLCLSLEEPIVINSEDIGRRWKKINSGVLLLPHMF